MQDPLLDEILGDDLLDNLLPEQEPPDDGQALPPKRVTPEGFVQDEVVKRGFQAGGSRLNRWAGSFLSSIYEGARSLRPIGVQEWQRQDEGIAALAAEFFGGNESLPNVSSTDGRQLTYRPGTPESQLQQMLLNAMNRGDSLPAYTKSKDVRAFMDKHKLRMQRFDIGGGGVTLFPGLADTFGTFGEAAGAGLNKLLGTQLFGNTENWNEMWRELSETYEVWTPEGRQRFLEAMDRDPGQTIADAAMLVMLKGKAAGVTGRGATAVGRAVKNRNVARVGTKLQRLDNVLNEGFTVPGVALRPELAGQRRFLSRRDPLGRLRTNFGVVDFIDPEGWGEIGASQITGQAVSGALSPFRGEFDASYRERLRRAGIDPATAPETIMSRSQRVAQIVARREVEGHQRTIDELELAVTGFEKQFEDILAEAHESGDIGAAAKALEAAYNSFEGKIRAEAHKGYDKDTPERRDFIMSLRNTYSVLYGEGGLIDESQGLEASLGTSDFDANPILRGFDETMRRIAETGEAGIDAEFVEGVEAGVEPTQLQGGQVKQTAVDIGDVNRSNREGQPRRVMFSPTWESYAADYKVAPLDRLVASHTADGAENPLFAELAAKVAGEGAQLQTRDFNRRMVHKIASNLRPEAVLLDLKMTNVGTPIAIPVEHEGETYYLVLAGNNRVEAFEVARREYPSDWTLYQQELANISPDYGIDPVSTADVDSPVLYRELLDTEGMDLAKFAADSNVEATRRQATGEQAVKDALTLEQDVLSRFNFNLTGSIGDILQDARNQDALRTWLGALEDESGDLYTETTDPTDGSKRTELTKSGVERLENALFRKVFASESGLRMLNLFETVQNSNVKNIERAVSGAFPFIAAVEVGVRRGEFGEQYAIANKLAEAVVGAWEITRQGAVEGVGMRDSISRFLAQQEMAVAGVTAIVSGVSRDLLEVLDAAVDRPAVVGEFMQGYRDQVSQQMTGDSLFGDADAESQEAIVFRLKDQYIGGEPPVMGDAPRGMFVTRGNEYDNLDAETRAKVEEWDADPNVFYRIGSVEEPIVGQSTETVEWSSILRDIGSEAELKRLQEIIAPGDFVENHGQLDDNEVAFIKTLVWKDGVKLPGIHAALTLDDLIQYNLEMGYLFEGADVLDGSIVGWGSGGDTVNVFRGNLKVSHRENMVDIGHLVEPVELIERLPRSVLRIEEDGMIFTEGAPPRRRVSMEHMTTSEETYRSILEDGKIKGRDPRDDQPDSSTERGQRSMVDDIIHRARQELEQARLNQIQPTGNPETDRNREALMAHFRMAHRAFPFGIREWVTHYYRERPQLFEAARFNDDHDAYIHYLQLVQDPQAVTNENMMAIVDQWSPEDRQDYIFGIVDVSYLPGDWMNAVWRMFDEDLELGRRVFDAESAREAIDKWEPVINDNFILRPADIEKRELEVRVALERHQQLDIKGREIAGHREIAILAQALRDPAMEFGTVVYLNESQGDEYIIEGHEVTTLGSPKFTNYRDYDKIEAQRKKYGADTKVVFIHNHPSASARFSDGDKDAMKRWRELLGESYLGSIVINSGTYAINWVLDPGKIITNENIRLNKSDLGWDPEWRRPQGGAEPGQWHIRRNDPMFPQGDETGAALQWQTSTIPNEQNIEDLVHALDEEERKLTRSMLVNGLLRFAESFKTDRNWITVAMSSGWGRLNALIQLKDFHLVPRQQRARWLRDLSIRYGGSEVHIHVGRGDWFRKQDDAINFFKEINADDLGGGIMSVRVGNNRTAWINTIQDYSMRTWKPEFPSGEMVSAVHEGAPDRARPDFGHDFTRERTPYTYGNAEDFSTALRRKIQAMERSDTSNPQELRWYKKLRAALEADMTESLRAHRPDLSDQIDAIDLAYAVGMTKMNSQYAKHIQKNMGSDLVEGTGNYRNMVMGLLNPSMDVESVRLVYELIGGFESDAGRRLRRVFLDELFTQAQSPAARQEAAKRRRGDETVLKSWERVSPRGLSSALGRWQRKTGQYPAELLEAILGKETVDRLYDLDSVGLQFERMVRKLGGSQTAPWIQEWMRSDYRAERLWYSLRHFAYIFGGVGATAGAGAGMLGAGNMMSLGLGIGTFITAWLGTSAFNIFMEYIKDRPVGRRYLLEGTVASMSHVLTGDPIFASADEHRAHLQKVDSGQGVRPSRIRQFRRLGRVSDRDREKEE